MSTGAARDAGFTLVECIVALALLASALSAGYVGFKGVIDSRRIAERRAEALELARTLIAMEGIERELATGRREGSDAGGLAWTVDVDRSVGDAATGRAVVPAYRVTVTVGTGGRELVSLTTIRLGRIR